MTKKKAVKKKTSKKKGRPTSYKPKYCEEIIAYFSIEPYREVKEKSISARGKVTYKSHTIASDVPSLAGFACLIEVHRDTLQEWTKVHKEFSVAYKRSKQLQENFMIICGNKGLLQPQFAIFTAKNVMSWKDKQPGEDFESNKEQLTDEEINAKIAELIKKS